jgi:hypothetical protein
MKKGKTSRLNFLQNATCFFGTVDAKKLKSLYIVLQCWIEPTDHYENWERIVGNLERKIKHTVLESMDLITFKKYNIIDLDIRSSGIKEGKRSFANLEITLFLNEENENFKSLILRNKIKNIIGQIYKEDLMKSKYFKIHKSKSIKVSS